jgi:uncharacterized protein YqgC (DUF456 family)
MTIASILLALLLGLIGIIGAILPGLPWPQLWYAALWLLQFSLHTPFSRSFLIIRGILTIVITILDYLLPLRGTKKFWGTKRGKSGCILGMLIGLFAGPVGVITWPFLGAFLGEYLSQHHRKKALKSARGALLGFLSGILLKLLVSVIFLAYIIVVSIQHYL